MGVNSRLLTACVHEIHSASLQVHPKRLCPNSYHPSNHSLINPFVLLLPVLLHKGRFCLHRRDEISSSAGISQLQQWHDWLLYQPLVRNSVHRVRGAEVGRRCAEAERSRVRQQCIIPLSSGIRLHVVLPSWWKVEHPMPKSLSQGWHRCPWNSTRHNLLLDISPHKHALAQDCLWDTSFNLVHLD